MTLTLDAPSVVDRDVSFDALRAQLTGSVHTPAEPEYDALVSPRGTSPSRCSRPPSSPSAPPRTSPRPCASPVPTASPSACRPPATARAHAGRPPARRHRGLDEVTVHPEGWARVGAGVKWRRVSGRRARTAWPGSTAPPSDVGIVGYTTGGGVGPMARTYGIAADRVRAFEVVTGDGVFRRVTPTEHPDLFFALRGGKGAAGIVTAIEFDLIAPADLLRRRGLLRRRRRGRGHRPVAGLVRRPAGAGDDVLRALPAARRCPRSRRRWPGG